MHRYHSLKQLVDYFMPDGCIGVEIGVHHAETSIYMLKNCKKLKHLYCIDPYFNRDERYEKTKTTLTEYKNCTFLHMTAHKASSVVPDELDFVFIDGDHSYEAVLLDMQDWSPKVRSGGLFCGHDWCSDRQGVCQAGMKYFGENGHLFEPLISNNELKKMGLPYKIGGQKLIHKQRNTGWPVWWRIKK